MNRTLTTEWSTAELESLSRTLKAIAHPTRLAIIDMLENDKKMTVTDIYTTLQADQSSISHHLTILRSRGIVGQERQGKFIYYFLQDPSFLALMDCLTSIQRSSSLTS